MNQFKKGMVSLSVGVLLTGVFAPITHAADPSTSKVSAKSAKESSKSAKESSKSDQIEAKADRMTESEVSSVEQSATKVKKGKSAVTLTPEMLTMDFKSEISKVKDKLADQRKQIKAKREELSKLNLDGLTLDLEIQRVDKIAKMTYEKIQRTNKEIRETERAIEQVTLEISELEKELASREVEFRDRIKSSSRTGFFNYMEVILGADSFPEMLSRFTNIQRVVKTDNQVIEEYISLSAELDAKRLENEALIKTLGEKVAELTKIRADLLKENEGNKSEYGGVKSEKDRLLTSYRDLKLAYKETSVLLDKVEEQERMMVSFKKQAKLIAAREAKREKLRKKKEAAAKESDAYKIVDAVSDTSADNSVDAVPDKKDPVKSNADEADEFLADENVEVDLSDTDLSIGDYGLNPYLELKRVELISKAGEIGIDLITTSGLRTFAEQTRLYNQGRTTPGSIVTNARAGESWHNWGFAFDVAFDNGRGTATWDEYDMNGNGSDDWQEIGAIGRSIGLEWGGDWANFLDRPHFEYTFGKTISEMMATRGL